MELGQTINGSFEIDRNITIYARLVYINPNYGTQIFPETSKKIENVKRREPVLSIEQTRLADVVSVGDYVAYDASSGEGSGKTYTTNSTLTGASETSTYNSSDSMKWKVLSVDKENGIVELMAENQTSNEVTFYGKTGYKNAETVLNDIGAVYGYGTGAIGGRNINIEDINKLEEYTPEDDTTSYTYTSGTFISNSGSEIIATTNNPVTVGFTANTVDKSTNKFYSYETKNFAGKDFWIASRMIYIEYRENESSRRAIYMLRFMESGSVANVTKGDLFTSVGVQTKQSRAVLPVVTLQTNIQTTGKDESGAWIIQGKRTIKATAKDEQVGLNAYQYSKDGTLTSTSDGWTNVEKTTNLEAPEYEIGEYGIYYFYVKDIEGEVFKTQIETGKVEASAKIGESIKLYSSVQNAISDSGNSQATITILENPAGVATINSGQNLTLNLNRRTLKSNKTVITNNGTLSIVGNNGILTSGTGGDEYPAVIENSGTLTINDGKIVGKPTCIKNNKSSTVTLNDTELNTTDTYSTVIINDGSMLVTSGNIDARTYIENNSTGNLKLKNTTIVSSDKAISSSGTLTIEGSAISADYEAISVSGGATNVQSGKIVSKTDIGIGITNSATLTVGTKDNKINNNGIEIIGSEYGVKIDSNGTFNFYDGIAKGQTGAINGNITKLEDYSEILSGTETINSVEYKTSQPKLSQYTITYNTNYNYISNGDFSNGTTGWNKNYNSVYEIDTSKKYNGLNSLKVTATSSYWDGIYHDAVALKTNTIYKVSSALYNDGGIPSDRSFRVYFDEHTSSGDLINYRYYIDYNSTTAKNTWSRRTAYYTTNSSSANCIPRCDYSNNSTSAAHVWIADIRLEEVSRQDTKTHYDSLGTLPIPTRSGYEFAGWYTAETGGTRITSDTPINGNVEYYAHWTTNEPPTYTGMEIKNITTTGYDVYVYGVKDSASGVNRVQFPTWTTNNGQDDIQKNWTTSEEAKGTLQADGTTWVYRVNVTDHKNEAGEYNTHVYMYDNAGNSKIIGDKITVPAVNITFDSGNLIYKLDNVSNVKSEKMTYSVNNGTVTVTSSASDGYGFTNGRVYLEANKQYVFSCKTDATWGYSEEEDTVEAFLMLTTDYTKYKPMWGNTEFLFTPTVTGEYALRLDVNQAGKTHTFSDIEVRYYESVEKGYGSNLGTLPTLKNYSCTGWYTEKTGGTKISETTKVPAEDITYYAHGLGKTLTELAEVGDYVNYNAASGNGSGKSYTATSSLTGSSTTTKFSSRDSMKWRVLSVDKTAGTITLISADPTTNNLTLSGKTGYKNAETILKNIGAVYGSGNGATSGRSITIDDIEQYSSFDKTTFTQGNYKYGSTKSYTSGTFISDDGTETTASTTNPVTVTQTSYGYVAQSYFSNSIVHNMIFKKSTDINTNKSRFFLASRSIGLHDADCAFYIREVNLGGVYDYGLITSAGTVGVEECGVVPIVTLKANIQTSGKDSDGAWNLIVE